MFSLRPVVFDVSHDTRGSSGSFSYRVGLAGAHGLSHLKRRRWLLSLVRVNDVEGIFAYNF